MASHLGGTRDPMVVAWPAWIKASGLRRQFTHCIDIGPTILEAAGIPEPTHVDGIEQEPMDGTSFLYTTDDADAQERHTVQYFEMLGSRAMYKDGWWAGTRLDKAPWDFSPRRSGSGAPAPAGTRTSEHPADHAALRRRRRRVEPARDHQLAVRRCGPELVARRRKDGRSWIRTRDLRLIRAAL